MSGHRIYILTIILGALPLAAHAGDPWESEPISRWNRDFSHSIHDTTIPIPGGDLEAERIGDKTVMFGLFDRWILNDSISAGRSSEYADITRECKGRIELDFALTAEEWKSPPARRKYYRSLDLLIDKVGSSLLADYGNEISGQEAASFLISLHALAWQESKWEHYIRYKDWFFVVLSGGSYNKLEDWGITQVARSSKDPTKPFNTKFFNNKGYCSLGSSLYYGFMEFFFTYMAARDLPCNQTGGLAKILGAYNQYSSGVSLCHDGFSEDPKFHDYQIRAMAGFARAQENQPWKSEEME